MKKSYVWLLALIAALFVAGCNMQKGPAEQAVAGAEAALDGARDAAQKYDPEDLGSVEAQLGQMKDSFQKGDYAGVLAAAPAMTTAINGLKDKASQKKADAEAALAKAKDDWGPASAAVPKMVDDLSKKIDSLSKSKKLPKGVTKDNVAAAKTGLDSLKSMWNDATNASNSGDFTTAMAKADAVKAKAADIMKSIGMTPPS
jgi:hypothetical protein